MEASKLIKGKTYQFYEPCTGKTEQVTYNRETINHFVFIGETEEKWICATTLKTNISELKSL